MRLAPCKAHRPPVPNCLFDKGRLQACVPSTLGETDGWRGDRLPRPKYTPSSRKRQGPEKIFGAGKEEVGSGVGGPGIVDPIRGCENMVMSSGVENGCLIPSRMRENKLHEAFLGSKTLTSFRGAGGRLRSCFLKGSRRALTCLSPGLRPVLGLGIELFTPEKTAAGLIGAAFALRCPPASALARSSPPFAPSASSALDPIRVKENSRVFVPT